MNILLLTTGSVSAYLSDKIHKMYVNADHEVKHYSTDTAYSMIENDPNLNHRLITDIFHPNISVNREILDWRDKENHPIYHIDNVHWADICVLCPADYNIVGKMANGIADDFISTILAARGGSGKPLYIAEAMNTMMYSNPIHLDNVAKIKRLIPNVHFIAPTMKKLACGDYGIGGLADVNAIFDITTGYKWKKPISDTYLIGKHVYDGNDTFDIQPPKGIVKYDEYLPKFNEPGSFGAKRKYDRHEGVDIYCKDGSIVTAVEDGEVVDSYQYTGEAANCGWWNDTWCIKVKGRSGVVTYGELSMPLLANQYPAVGSKVKVGDFIGVVGTVLKEGKLRTDIRNHNVAMLHMELRTENCHLDGWKLDAERDKRLLDPTPYLHTAY